MGAKEEEEMGQKSKKKKDEPKKVEVSKKTEEVKKADLKGFGRGLKAEKIIGTTITPDDIFYLVKWAGGEEADLLPSKEVHKAAPQIVIKYHEDRMRDLNNKTEEEEE